MPANRVVEVDKPSAMLCSSLPIAESEITSGTPSLSAGVQRDLTQRGGVGATARDNQPATAPRRTLHPGAVRQLREAPTCSPTPTMRWRVCSAAPLRPPPAAASCGVVPGSSALGDQLSHRDGGVASSGGKSAASVRIPQHVGQKLLRPVQHRPAPTTGVSNWAIEMTLHLVRAIGAWIIGSPG